jgi:hypothetical protein
MSEAETPSTVDSLDIIRAARVVDSTKRTKSVHLHAADPGLLGPSRPLESEPRSSRIGWLIWKRIVG